MNPARGTLFVVSSPSGGGKTTVIREAQRRNPGLRYSVSATTRPPRDGEREGIDYIFMKKEEFEKGRKGDAFLESALVHGDCYGTPRGPVSAWLGEGRSILLDLDVQGAEAVKREAPESVLVFLAPPSFGILRERLEKRGTDSSEAVERRVRHAEEELRHQKNYDFIIFNHRVEDAVRQLLSVVAHFEHSAPDGARLFQNKEQES
jgi:guanylate kinase